MIENKDINISMDNGFIKIDSKKDDFNSIWIYWEDVLKYTINNTKFLEDLLYLKRNEEKSEVDNTQKAIDLVKELGDSIWNTY